VPKFILFYYDPKPEDLTLQQKELYKRFRQTLLRQRIPAGILLIFIQVTGLTSISALLLIISSSAK